MASPLPPFMVTSGGNGHCSVTYVDGQRQVEEATDTTVPNAYAESADPALIRDHESDAPAVRPAVSAVASRW